MPLCLNLVTQARSVDPSSISVHCILNVTAWLLRDLFSFLSSSSWKTLFVVVQSLSCVRLFATSWTAACQAPLSSAVSWSLLRFMSIESMMLSNHLTLCLPFLLLPSLFCSIRVFSRESALRPKYWSFSSSPSSEYSGFPLGLTGLILQSKGLS